MDFFLCGRAGRERVHIFMELTNKGVFVSGGASGLGAACVRLLTRAGAKVVIADLNSELGEQLAQELGGSTRFVKTNVTDEESTQAAIQAAVTAFGGLHIAKSRHSEFDWYVQRDSARRRRDGRESVGGRW